MVSRARLLLASLAAVAAFGAVGASTASADSTTVTITSVSPSTGYDSGGDTVTIKGTGFWCNTGGQTVQDPATGNNDPNPNDYMTVNFGSNAATINQIDSDSQMEVTTPSGEGTVDVVAKCVQGTTSASATSPADRYKYINTVSGSAGSTNQGSGGASLGSSDSSSSGPSTLAQTGGGPAARPVASTTAAPLWLALLIVPLLAGAALVRRRLHRR